MRVVVKNKDTPADPAALRSVDQLGRQLPTPRKRQRPVRPDGMDVLAIRSAVVMVTQRNATVDAVRHAWANAERRRAEFGRGGEGGGTARSTRRRWGAFLLQTGRVSLTAAQRRSVRRRSTREQLADLTLDERRILGA